MKGAAFRALNALKLEIERHQNSKCGDILKLVYKHLESFEELAQTTLKTDLDDAIASHFRELRRSVSAIFEDPESGINGDEIQNRVGEIIRSFAPRLKKVEHECSDGLYNFFPDDEDDENDDVSTQVIGVGDVYERLKDKVMSTSHQVTPLDVFPGISRSEVYQQLKDKIMSSTPQQVTSVFGTSDIDQVYHRVIDNMIMSSQQVTSLVGMPGMGKTTLANKIFNDPAIVERFDRRVWIRVGKRYRGKDIPGCMLEEMDPEGLPGGDEEAVAAHLKASLKRQRYLIVLDDVWDSFAMHRLFPIYSYGQNRPAQPFLHPESGSRILITSRLLQLDEWHKQLHTKDMTITMRLLTKEESWDLLRTKVFSQGSCPPQLEKAGKKISENCEGLPLTIVALARLLSQKEDKCNPEYWEEVAAKSNHQIFLDAYDQISKVLLPSYTYLPPLLKMCFMFIGLFPPKYEVPRSRLINLWLADGFFELNVHISKVSFALECLGDLVCNSVVMVYQQSSYDMNYNVKTCGLHSSLWHLSKKKAKETKFALILSTRYDVMGDGMDGHHRLSFQNNVLFAIKDVHKLVEENCASAARSLFCFGPYHQYQVPLCFRLRFLKELDALSIRFYEFPMEVVQLVGLVYLSLTVSGMIPSSIYQLQLLEFLIVDRHQNIKSYKEASYLPVEIWSLQKLKHLQVMGSDLPNPNGASLSCLSTLLNVSARSCTVAVLEGIPNLKKLKIQIEFAPDYDGKPLTVLGTQHISYLSKLRYLKCVIANPGDISVVAPLSSFMRGMNFGNFGKLSLTGLFYPWKEMKHIASLPSLFKLKLKNYAFQGSKWDVGKDKFSCLMTLVIEDTDLVYWKFGSDTFRNLVSLTIKQCYQLKKIRGKFGVFLERIKLVDCNPSCVEEIKKALRTERTCVIDVHSSWDDRRNS